MIKPHVSHDYVSVAALTKKTRLEGLAIEVDRTSHERRFISHLGSHLERGTS